ncbi:hypothetical protein LTR08_008628 [Meristemomyces frigidus]|nr:hypothetical protein LTR08_008628 [Meristemomyces frigidus]
MTALFASAFTWQLPTVGPIFPAVQDLWFGGLLLSLIAVALAMQQSVYLYRLSSNDNGMQRLAESLKRRPRLGQPIHPSRVQVLVWQVPVMLLNVVILLFAVGLLGQIFGGYEYHGHSGWITVLVLVAAGFGGACWLVSWISISAKLASTSPPTSKP